MCSLERVGKFGGIITRGGGIAQGQGLALKTPPL